MGKNQFTNSYKELQEIWLPIPGFSSYYDVSDTGKVRSYWQRISNGKGGGTHCVLDIQPRRLLVPALDTRGYPSVVLVSHVKKISVCTYKLVLWAFVGPCPPGMECRHLDGIKTNNSLTNLCWGTHGENVEDIFRHGNKNHQGTNHPQCKLTENHVFKIRELFAQGGYSKAKLGRMFDVTAKHIEGIILRKTWSHIP